MELLLALELVLVWLALELALVWLALV